LEFLKNRRTRRTNTTKRACCSNIPEGMGAIIRTCAEGANDKDLLKDLHFLVDSWREIEKKYAAAQPEEKIHEDLDLILQMVRDHLDDSIESVIVDDPKTHTAIYKFVRLIAPEYSHIIKIYDKADNIFQAFNIEKQIQEALEKKVHLKSGGSLIIETTEAMTVIDVNQGNLYKSNLEDTILKTNLEAAEEIARQLRLRNIGGLIVIDFIDMASSANRQKLFRFFEKILKEKDKFQSVVLKISEFGIVQMTRKRSGKTLMQQLMHSCPTCHSLGFVKTVQTKTYELFRLLKLELAKLKNNSNKTLLLHPDLFNYISSIEYEAILTLEKSFGGKITLASDPSIQIGHYRLMKG
jgi:ribonuclease G